MQSQRAPDLRCNPRWSLLPDELWAKILSFVSTSDKLQVSSTHFRCTPLHERW